jgi:hypothetical protein
MLVINVTYMILIQETSLIIYFGLRHGQLKISSIFIVTVYFISLIFFTINQWFYPFPFFRTKCAQFNIILLKIIAPIFIVSDRKLHFLLLIYIIVFYAIDVALTNKNRNNSSINRLLLYKLYSMLVIIVLACYYSI